MTYVEGVDVSRHQGIMDWQKCYDRGARFAFIRAGSIDSITGVCYEDYQFQRNSEIAPEYMPCGYYFYTRPNFDAFKQSDFFSNLISSKPRKLPAVNDAEAIVKMEMMYIEKRHRQFCERTDENLNDETMIYSNVGYWSYPNIYARKGVPAWAAVRPFWVANFTIADKPWMPVTWDKWLFWQFSADGNGLGHEYGATGSHAIDINRFNGDAEQFAAYIGEDVEPPPDPPEEPPHEIFIPFVMKVNAQAGLFTRKTPEIANNKAGALFNNTEVTVIEEDGAWRKCRAEYWSHGNYLTQV